MGVVILVGVTVAIVVIVFVAGKSVILGVGELVDRGELVGFTVLSSIAVAVVLVASDESQALNKMTNKRIR